MRYIFFYLLFFITIVSNGQPKKISFDHLMVANGMPENYAIDITQDKNGYIWCGTQRGLMKYDGYSIKAYRQQLPDGNNSINGIGSVFVDRNGVVWAGTIGNCLLRYNAQADSFTVYKPDSVKTGTFSYITNIFEDNQNNLWLKVENPAHPLYLLQRFDKKTGEFFPFKISSHENADIPSNHITGLLSDKAGQTWIGTENGIFIYDYSAKRFKSYLVSADTMKKRALFNVYEPPSEPGILYMSVGLVSAPTPFTPKGFVRYDVANNKATFYYHDDANPGSLSNDATSSFYEDSKKRLWIGTSNSLIYFDRNKNTFQSFSTGDSKSVSYDVIKEDMDGNFWITGEIPGQGLTCFNPEKKLFARYYAEPGRVDGLASNYIEQLFADRAGNIWLAFRNWGIERINRVRSIFTSFMYDPKDPSGYPGGFTHSFAETGDGIYWLATSEGLIKYDRRKGFTKVKVFNEPAKDKGATSQILLDNDGFIWFRSLHNGLIKYNPKTGLVKSFQHNDSESTSLSNDAITCLYNDHNGVIWIGTDGGGLCRYNKDKGNFTCYPYINNSKVKYSGTALDDGTVSSIHEDRYGRLWISTNLGGLNLMNKDNGTFKSYFDESAGVANIDGIEDADSGRLWLGSYFLGLRLFDPAKGTVVKVFNEKNGLVSDILNWLKKDNGGNLWIGSGRGLSRLNPKTYAITNYTSLQGLPSNVLYRPFVDDKGEFFIGCKFGFFKFSPEDMKPNLIVPMINLESLSFADIRFTNKMDTMLVSDGQQIKLEHNQNRIIFHYTGLQFENSLLNTYKYKLEGYDEDWIMGGESRYATYTNLSPGTYTFYVKAANMDGVWNDQPASIIIIIHPPWWKTWWAYLSYAVIFGMLVWVFISYRSRKLTLENKMLEEKVTYRTSQLQKYLDELKSAQSQLIQSEKMASLGELTAGIAHEIQNPLNFVNNFSDINKELLAELNEDIEKENYSNIKSIAKNVISNEEKINHHGKRADAIVKGMLQHSRSSSGVKEPTGINKLSDEYIRLCYHGLRTKDKSFNATIKTDFDESIGKINVIPQDIGRVVLNLINNAFYAVDEKKKQSPHPLTGGEEEYEPLVTVSTRRLGSLSGDGGKIEIRVSDNGNGIPRKILDKIFQPFFTTKPTGQGTGLGLSLSYDIIKAHGGEIEVETNEGEGTTFIIRLPMV
ncbi:MAG: two-component regulator propeller domain-containing protein [Chitinophagaceae bacterium]